MGGHWVLRIDVLTLFPGMMEGALHESIIGRAQENGSVDIRLINFRDYTTDKHRTVDDYPYGGGAGMVLKPEPVYRAVEDVLGDSTDVPARVILMSPQGIRFSHKMATELAAQSRLVFVCGHYEGFDERIRTGLVTDEVSIGDYVLTGGELPAMVMIDAVVRLLPGVLGNDHSAHSDSFSDGLLEFPQFTRPEVFRGMAVPAVLLSGHHGQIARWRRKQSLLRTRERRPDLLDKVQLDALDRKLLQELDEEGS